MAVVKLNSFYLNYAVVCSTSPVIVSACKSPNYVLYTVNVQMYMIILYVFSCYIVPSKSDDIRTMSLMDT